MTITIVLSTFNGSKYIVELLESIRNQTIAADEVLISDDGSSDNTAEIIKNYIEQHSLDKWNFQINEHNRGWCNNFKSLIFKAKGDLIFPCDQDDIWELDKLEQMKNCCMNNPKIKLLCCDYDIIYMDKAVKFPSTKISKVSNSGDLEHIINSRAILAVDRPGCTYCISKSLLPIMKKFDFEDYPHDALAWRSAATEGSLYILHSRLIKFRRHGLNASDQQARSVSSRIEVCQYYQSFLKIMKDNMEVTSHRKNASDFVERAYRTQILREEALRKKSLLALVYMADKIQYLPSVNTYIADLKAVMFKK